MPLPDTKTAILEIRQKQEELTRLIFNLDSTQAHRLEIPQQTIDLNEGEHYAGIILSKDPGNSHNLILLPGEPEEETDWDVAMRWAANVGGHLPTRREQSLLYANLKDQFKATGYWSREQQSNYAWMQHFGDGGQYFHSMDLVRRARAVRRILIRGG